MFELNPKLKYGFDPSIFAPPKSAAGLYRGEHRDKMGDQRGGTDKQPDSEKTTNVDNLKRHLQTAVMLELKTIPLYLFAAYTIKNPGTASWHILMVVKQEMLHLALAGNLLCSIGGLPILYHENFTPTYPTKMLYQEIVLNLRPATKGNVRTFMELERPEPEPLVDDPYVDKFETYGSIGAFYKAIEQGIAKLFEEIDRGANMVHTAFGVLDKKNKKLFDPRSFDKQFTLEDGSWFDDNMIVVKDLDSARRAIKVIIDQGEGSPRILPPPNLSEDGRMEPPALAGVRSHFEIFEDLYKGPSLNYVAVIENPRTEDYQNNSEIYPVLRACDAAYCYLLLTIEKMWQYSGPRRTELVTNNMHNLMHNIIRPLAQFLVKQPVPDSNKYFAPCFNYFSFGGRALNDLQELMTTVADKHGDLKVVRQFVDGLIDVQSL